MASPSQALISLYLDYLDVIGEIAYFLDSDLPATSSGLSKWAQEVGRRSCRKYARQRGNVPFLTSDPTWDGICNPYLNSINEDPTQGGDYDIPFTGGQCSGKKYQLQASGTWYINYPPPQGPTSPQSWGGTINCNDSVNNLLGPISASVEINSSGYPGFVWRGGNGGEYTQILVANPLGVITLASASVTPCTGPECAGDPPPIYTPPTFPPNLPTLPPPVNPAPGFGINWEVNILPDGEIIICIAGECSTSYPPNPGGGPDSGGGPGTPDGPPQTTDPSDPNNPNEIDGSAKDGYYLTGLKIQVVQSPPNYQGLGDIYYRSCWVWMGPDPDLLDMVVDGKAIESGQFVIPDTRDCNSFKVRANPGFRVSVQAYSRPKQE